MRDPRNALRPFVEKETKAAREKLASEHFKLEALRDGITEAAARGEGSMRLPLEGVTAELRGTDAAKAMEEWCKENRFRLEWTERIIERPNGLRLRTAEAVIIWIEETLSS